MSINKIFSNPTAKQVIFQIKFPNLFSMENKIGDLQLEIMEKFPQSSLLFRRQIVFADIGPGAKLESIPSDLEEETGKKIWQFKSSNNFQLDVLSDSLNISSRNHKTYNLEGGDKSRDIIKSENNKKDYREISEIKINHCAVTPTLKAVNTMTSISMIKSQFENYNLFMKALIANSGTTDIGMLTGAASLGTQSLERDLVRQVVTPLLYIINEFKKAKQLKIVPNLDDLLFKAVSCLDYEIQKSLIEEVNKNKEIIYHLI